MYLRHYIYFKSKLDLIVCRMKYSRSLAGVQVVFLCGMCFFLCFQVSGNHGLNTGNCYVFGIWD